MSVLIGAMASATPTVAALYVDPCGPYPRMPGVDAWDETRDARGYEGPWPVVAHPPCGPWGSLRHMCKQGPETKALFRDALTVVRLNGGVLEHPAKSLAFAYHGVPRPGDATDTWGGRTYEVEQLWWGHVARKKTWIYVVRVNQIRVLRDIRKARAAAAGRKPTHWVSGGRKKRPGCSAGTVPPGIKVCSDQQRRRTPPAFAAWLVSLARAARL